MERELQWQKLDLDMKLYRHVFLFLCLIEHLNRRPEFITGLEKSPRPTLQDRIQDQYRSSQDQDRDQDHQKSVSSALEIETELSRTTSLDFSS